MHGAGMLLDLTHDLLGLLDAAVHQQPARALGNETPHIENCQADERANRESDAPAEIDAEDRWVERDQGRERTERGAEPEAAVNGEIGLAAILGGDEFIDRRVDGRILAADSGA